MGTRRTIWRSLLAMPLFAVIGRAKAAPAAPDPVAPAAAQTAPPAPTPGMELLTIFLRHDESKTLDEINQHLKKTGWFDHFPPPGVEVVSWYVLMGIGQVVTLRFPAERLREINVLVEREAWGGYHTEFYATYDYKALYPQLQAKMKGP